MSWQDRAYNRESDERIPPVRLSLPQSSRLTWSLILACVVVFFGEVFGPPGLLTNWGGFTFRGGLAVTQPWRWITYQYLHGGVGHLFFNCIGIFFFVPPLERRWGWKKTLSFYTVGGVVAAVCFGILSLVWPTSYIIGASGSVMAVLGACALLFPEMTLILLFFPVAIRPATALIAIVYFLSVSVEHSLSDACHLGGLAFGFFAPYLGMPFLGRVERGWQKRRLARAAVDERQEQEMVDRILQKVHNGGMNSLSWNERRALKRATDRQKRRDQEAARRRGSFR